MWGFFISKIFQTALDSHAVAATLAGLFFKDKTVDDLDDLFPWLVTKRRPRFEKWKKFHKENPAVFQLFTRFAIQAYDAGRDHFGAHAIGERIRWFTAVETRGHDYKLNDHHLPYYARLLAGTDERFEEFFEFRDAKFDSCVEEIVEYHNSLAQP